jgi:hypothetical protein
MARATTTLLMAGSDGWRSAFDNERVILPCRSSSSIYGGAAPPLRWWRGSFSTTVAWMRGACRHDGPRAWEVRPQKQPPLTCNTGFNDDGLCPPSLASGGVYERQIDDGGSGFGPVGLDLGS